MLAAVRLPIADKERVRRVIVKGLPKVNNDQELWPSRRERPEKVSNSR